eukprot:TRINITY_DN1620_c0_g1_i1.p1 TRINITY_DN1620_c0_g1~~TRINITY_DN1620_c0_g1_i1.p1  ORF type:complete len:488 (-),score=108.27 TRINITY_DN1620_c0_g1_i1:116-1579(-)
MTQGSLEDEAELRHFLRIARPEWSLPRKKGGSINCINKVIEKLRAIGINDTETLVQQIEKNTINDQLAANGYVPFSRETIECIRRQLPFIRSLESLDTPNVRQVGQYAYVPQMLSKKRIASHEFEKPSGEAGRGRRRPIGAAGASASGSAKSSARAAPSLAGGSSRLVSSASEPSLGGTMTELRLRGVVSCAKQRRRQPLELPLGLVPRDDSEVAESLASCSRSLLSSTAPPSVFAELDGTRREALPPLSHLNDTTATSSHASKDTLRSTAARSLASTLPTGALAAAATAGSSEGLASSGETGLPLPARGASRHNNGHARTIAGGELASLRLNGNEVVPSVELVRGMLREGAQMRQEATEARWSPAFTKAWQQQGEDMLREQEAMDERNRFVRSVSQDDMRPVITRNIEARLREEALRDKTEGVNITHRCMNIRKHLASMLNSRRDLQSLRSRMMAVTGEEQPTAKEDLANMFGDTFRSAAASSLSR